MPVKKNNREIIPQIFFGISLIFSFFICKTAIFNPNGVRDFYHLNNKLISVKNENFRLREKNADLEEKISSLKRNSFYFEKVVREELGLVKKGEVVFEFLGDKK